MDRRDFDQMCIAAIAQNPNPREAAAIVMVGLACDEYGDVLDCILPEYVRVVNTRARMPTNPSPQPTIPEASSKTVPSAAGRSTQEPGYSWKVAGVRAWWQGRLDNSYCIDGQWKHLRHMTRDDVLFLAADRRKRAEQQIATAERWERLADVMTRTNARYIIDIPADAALEIFAEPVPA